MKLINFFGGPGAGKTTIAAYLFYRLKQAGYRAELVGEAARELIYDRNPDVTAAQLSDNQLLISGLQYERIKRLERHGIEIAISDSPLSLGLVYSAGLPEHEGLKRAVAALETNMPKPLNVFVRRTPGNYDQESRSQTEAQAMALDDKILEFGSSFLTIQWGQEEDLADRILKCLDEEEQRDARGN